MKNKKIIVLIVISLVFVFLIPLIIDWMIVGNGIPSNISNSDWVGFFGGYIGAVIGCVISLIGIVWTIKFTREQNRLDRELQIRPYFDVRYVDKDNFYHTNSWLGYVEVHTWDNKKYGSQLVGSGLLYLKNIGAGPATNLDFKVKVENISIEHEEYFINQNIKVTTNSVMAGEQSELTIAIYSIDTAPKNEDIVWDDKTGYCEYDHKKVKTPERFSFSVFMEYSDLLGNRFEQKLSFDASYLLSLEKGKDGKHICSLYLKEIDVPHKKSINK